MKRKIKSILEFLLSFIALLSIIAIIDLTSNLLRNNPGLLEYLIYFLVISIFIGIGINGIKLLYSQSKIIKIIFTLLATFFLLNSILYSSTNFFPQAGKEVKEKIEENKEEALFAYRPWDKTMEYGYKNTDGVIVIKPMYLDARDFSEGLGAIQKQNNFYCRDFLNCKWGYIDASNRLVIDNIFDEALSFSEGKAAVVYEGGFAYEEPKYYYQMDDEDLYYDFKAQKSADYKERWGYIRKNGSFILYPQFDWAKSYVNGYAAVKKNGKWGFIDSAGELVIDFLYNDVRDFHEGLAAVEFEKWGSWGYIDTQGDLIIKPKYQRACDFINDLAAVNVLPLEGELFGDGYLINREEERIKKDTKNFVGNCDHNDYDDYEYTMNYRMREIFKRLFFIIFVI